MIDGAAFYLFCHDDIVLKPSATQAMVEEAFRENAGIVGAKIVDADAPDTLLEIGWSVDRFGFRTPVAEPGELDQSQHDATRDTFAVSDAAVLVRSDLFATIEGFSPDLTSFDADIDLCWRAHIAGARVIVAPSATVAHRQAGIERAEFAHKRRIEYRARGRMLLTNYTASRMLTIVPLAMFGTFLEALASLLTLQFDRAYDIVAAWAWNLVHLPRTLKMRGAIKRYRAAPDAEVARFQVRGSAAISSFLRGTATSSSDRINSAVGSSKSVIDKFREGPDRLATIMWMAVLVIVGVGSRSLIGGYIPAIREFTRSYESSTQMIGSFWSGWRTTGLGGRFAPPTVTGVMGAVSTLSLGSESIGRWLLIMVTIPLGIAGAWWWLRASTSSQVRGVALLIYAVAPVPFNALSEGRWSSMAMWAGAPWIIGLLGRAAGAMPFARAGERLNPVKAGVAISVVGALVALVFPGVPLYLLAITVALLLGSVAGLFKENRGTARWDQAAMAAASGAIGIVLLHLPWYLAYSDHPFSWASYVGYVPTSGGRLSVGDLLTLNTGSNSLGPVSGALLVVGLLAISTATAWRFRLALQGLLLVLLGLVGAWLSQVDVGLPMPAPETSLVLACAGFALLGGASMGAYESDISAGDFGWRQILAIISAAAMVVATFPALAAASDGRWRLPEEDHAEIMHTLGRGTATANFRTLWLGVDDAMPLGGWPLSNGVVFATTEGLDPQMGHWFPGPESTGTQQLREALDSAAAGETARLGHLLAPMGIRYVVVVRRYAPSSVTQEILEPAAAFIRSIEEQEDLKAVPMSVAFTVFENTKWFPTRSLVNPGVVELVGDDARSIVQSDLTAAKPALGKASSARSFSGELPDGQELLVGTTPDSSWELRVEGDVLESKTSFGWASRYTVAAGGKATLRWSTPTLRAAMTLLQLALWVAALYVLIGPALGRRLGRVGPATAGRRANRGDGEPPDSGGSPRRSSRGSATAAAAVSRERRLHMREARSDGPGTEAGRRERGDAVPRQRGSLSAPANPIFDTGERPPRPPAARNPKAARGNPAARGDQSSRSPQGGATDEEAAPVDSPPMRRVNPGQGDREGVSELRPEAGNGSARPAAADTTVPLIGSPDPTHATPSATEADSEPTKGRRPSRAAASMKTTQSMRAVRSSRGGRSSGPPPERSEGPVPHRENVGRSTEDDQSTGEE
jgi:GT2 family glycosyltransferase